MLEKWILVCETECPVSRAASSALRQAGLNGHEIFSLTDLDGLIQVNPPALVIMDTAQENGAGFEFLKNLRAPERGIGVIIFSYEDRRKIMEKVWKFGVMDFIPKSAEPQELVRSVWKCLEELSPRILNSLGNALGHSET